MAVVTTSEIDGSLTPASYASFLASVAAIEAAAKAHAGVTRLDRAHVSCCPREMLAAEVPLIKSGLLTYPRAVVVSPRDRGLFEEWAWFMAVGPAPQLRGVFTELDVALQWARARARSWWANGRTRASG